MICKNCIHKDICKFSVVSMFACEDFKDSNEVNSALEKQIPKKPIIHGYRAGREINTISFTCPICNKHINRENFCKHCGQAILWESDTE